VVGEHKESGTDNRILRRLSLEGGNPKTRTLRSSPPAGRLESVNGEPITPRSMLPARRDGGSRIPRRWPPVNRDGETRILRRLPPTKRNTAGSTATGLAGKSSCRGWLV